MISLHPVRILLLAAGLGTALPAIAGVTELQHAWEVAMYETPPDQVEQALASLADTARSELSSDPDDAALLIWEGIIVSSYAGEKGGLGALALAKEARRSLERALDIDSGALGGSAHTSLGSLYYKVPGWPIGFGNDKEARRHLQAALSINPTGIDANYFMGEFLYEQGDYDEAQRFLRTALDAPERPGRTVADRGRRAEVRDLLGRVEQQLH